MGTSGNARVLILSLLFVFALAPAGASAWYYDYYDYGYGATYYGYYDPYYYYPTSYYYYPQEMYYYQTPYQQYGGYGVSSAPSPYNYSYPVGDTDTFGSDICYWEGYGRGLCDFNPRQPVYDHWTGTWY